MPPVACAGSTSIFLEASTPPDELEAFVPRARTAREAIRHPGGGRRRRVQGWRRACRRRSVVKPRALNRRKRLSNAASRCGCPPAFWSSTIPRRCAASCASSWPAAVSASRSRRHRKASTRSSGSPAAVRLRVPRLQHAGSQRGRDVVGNQAPVSARGRDHVLTEDDGRPSGRARRAPRRS